MGIMKIVDVLQRGHAAAVALLLTLAAGCTYVNRPLNDPGGGLEQRRYNATRASRFIAAPATHPADGMFAGLAFSGGGLRSANFSAACLFELQRLGVLQHVDYISSVSGGSLTAALYCVSDDSEWNRETVERKLSYWFATDGLLRMLLPWNVVALIATDYDRTDLLAGAFARVLFTRSGRELTFNDLRADRPRLLLNGTDLQSGQPFIFCDDAFDSINSDLGRYPMAYAVAASAAVPVLLHQVTLRDFSAPFKQYRHVMDGSVVDNLGVKALVEAYRQAVRQGGASAYPKGAAFIVIDAKTTFNEHLNERGDTSLLETLRYGAEQASTLLVNRASDATLAEIILENSPEKVTAGELRRQRDELIGDGYVRMEEIDGRPVRVVHIALSRLAQLRELPSADFPQRVNSIETDFDIEPAKADQLYQAAELLIREKFEGQLRSIVDEMNASTRPDGRAPREGDLMVRFIRPR
jgi:predicted acylesterase/phospholipase RssA